MKNHCPVEHRTIGSESHLTHEVIILLQDVLCYGNPQEPNSFLGISFLFFPNSLSWGNGDVGVCGVFRVSTAVLLGHRTFSFSKGSCGGPPQLHEPSPHSDDADILIQTHIYGSSKMILPSKFSPF